MPQVPTNGCLLRGGLGPGKTSSGLMGSGFTENKSYPLVCSHPWPEARCVRSVWRKRGGGRGAHVFTCIPQEPFAASLVSGVPVPSSGTYAKVV